MKKKKILSIILGAVLILGVSTLSAYGVLKLVHKQNVEETGNIYGISWYNEKETEFEITTVEELNEFVKLSEYYTFEGQTVKLGADLVLNEGNAVDFREQKPENKWKPIMNFAGTFDGQNHTISGLYAKGFNGELAMFIRSDSRCVVKNFSLKNSYFETRGYSGVASIMAKGGGKFYGIYSDAIMQHRGQNVGGIASQVNKSAHFEECWFDGSIYTTHQGCGGLIDVVASPRVVLKHCLFSGAIQSDYDGTGTWTTGGKVGGMVGHVMHDCALLAEDCLSTGTMKVNDLTYIGGFVGVSSGRAQMTISQSYASSQTYKLATGATGANVNGVALCIGADRLVGTKAYEWTDLDFDNYWSAVEKQTPVLKRFAGEGLDLSGVKKAFDTSWYKSGTSVYEINTPEQLHGWYYVSAQDDFEDKVIKLGADIVLNEGKAAKWEKNPPTNEWISIPTFAGTFDGQGHTISGIYSVSDELYQGFINKGMPTSVVRNLYIKNSFFYNSRTELASVGSLYGELRGMVENVYSNAIIISEGPQAGGIMGRANDIDSEADEKEDVVTVRGCWFDGKVELRGEAATEGGGIIGRVVQEEMVFENCLNTGTISAETKSKSPSLGGLIGTSWASGFQMSNCFSDGKIIFANSNGNGGAIGNMPSKYTVANISSSYTTKEAGPNSGMGGSVYGIIDGGIIQLPEDWFIGQNAARYTDLDFNKIWVLQKDGTPRLAHFTKAQMSAKGIQKAYDTSWYKKDAKEVVIKTPEQFLGFTIVAMTDNFEGRTVKLGADIAMNLDGDWISIGSTSKRFSGIFDGQGHTISGLKQKASNGQMGLFAATSITSVLKNFSLKDSTFEYYNDAGNEKEVYAIVGTVASDAWGDLEKVYSNATLISNGSYVGGIVGGPNAHEDEKGEYTTVSIKDCWFDGEVRMVGNKARFGGGVAGVMIKGNFEFINCLNTGKVSNERPDAGEFIGGIVGADGNNNITCLIKNCVNTGTVTGVHWNSIGAILGGTLKATCNVTIENSYALDTSCVNHKGASVYATRNAGVLNGQVIPLSEEELKGAGAYIWTTLDFENHWAAIGDNYPVLKAFQTGIPLDGYKRMVDTSWYDEKKDSFTLQDETELYGLARLVNTGNTFKGKTVKLGADIELNTGDAANYETEAPVYKWTPIGNSVRFQGTFDGNMHTISGIYLNNSETQHNGLFGRIQDATITNVKLKNSYMASTKQNLGSVVGSGCGTISNVYSEVNLKGSDAFVGGIIGKTVDGNSKITDCWFAGTIVNDYSLGANGSGYVGGFIGYASNDPADNSVDLQHCLYTGHIDVSKVQAMSKTGNAGLVGVSHSNLNIIDCAVLGTATRDTTKNYIYSYMGGGKCNTLNAYRVASGWDGNYSGTATTDQRKDASGSVIGSAARTSMPELDWEKHWKTVRGKLPILAVFADDYAENPDLVDTSWYEKEPYVLTDRQDLYGFAELVNDGIDFEGKKVTLGADIIVNTSTVEEWTTTAPQYTWDPIGTADSPFKGTFDGNGYTISGLYYKNAQAIRGGLFGEVANATIRNLKLTNSYIEAKSNVGSIAGRGSGKFTGIYSDAIVKTGQNIGGGIIGETNAATTLKKCWFAGTVINNDPDNVYKSGGFVGGMIGYVSAGSASLTNCYSSGFLDVRGLGSYSAYFKAGGFVGSVVGTLTLSNCVNVSGLKADSDSKPVYSTVGHFNNNVTASGVYSCNSRKDTDCVPWPGGYSSSCGTLSYTGIDSSAIGAAAATKMSQLDFTYTWKTTDGWPELLVFAEDYADTSWYEQEPYVITDRKGLYGLAELVNGGIDFKDKTVTLGADIIVNTCTVEEWTTTAPQYVWDPIGTASNPFKGTFDGKGYSISGLYMNTTSNIAGLFGVVSGATVENVKLVNSYMEAKNNAGSIAGKGNGTFTSIYSDATIKTGYQFGGGIIGETNATTTLKKCWFAGTVINNDSDNVYKSGGFVGGMIGYVSAGSASLTNCYCSGFLDVRGMGTNSAYFKAGGFVGGVVGTLSLTNCVNVSGLKADNDSKPVYSTVGHFSNNVTASGVYSCNSKKDTDCVAWPGGYTTSCGTLSYTSIGDSAKGDAATTKMSQLDFTNTWQTTNGWPELRGVK